MQPSTYRHPEANAAEAAARARSRHACDGCMTPFAAEAPIVRAVVATIAGPMLVELCPRCAQLTAEEQPDRIISMEDGN